MSSAALVLLAAFAAAASTPSGLIQKAAVLVERQKGLDAGEIRALDKELGALDQEARKLGLSAVDPLAAAALDGKRPLKLRLWLISYLDAIGDPAVYAPLEKLLFARNEPDLLREAAARALASSPVSRRTRRRALCAALETDPGPETLDEVLLELRVLGCDDPAPLVRRALDAATPHPARAVEALAHSAPPSALDALDRIFEKAPPRSATRLAVLEAFLARVAQMRLEPQRWSRRVQALALEEARSPAAAAASLRLLGALGEPSAAAVVARFLDDKDPTVVVVAAESLLTLKAVAHRPAVQKIFDGFPQDPRFAGAEAVPRYERLSAVLDGLK